MTTYHRACRFDPEIDGRSIWELINDNGHWRLFIWAMDGTVAWEGCKVVEATSTDLDDADGLYENTGGSMSWPTERDINLSGRVGENRPF